MILRRKLFSNRAKGYGLVPAFLYPQPLENNLANAGMAIMKSDWPVMSDSFYSIEEGEILRR
jgi:hypothetical protein